MLVLESMRRGQRWLTAILIVFIGGVFAAFIGLGGPLTPDTSQAVVELDGRVLGPNDFYRMRAQQEEQFREQLGDQLNSKTAKNFLDSQTLRSLVDTAVLAHSARELGLRVSKQEVQDLIRNVAGFRDESGRFDQQSFIQQIEYEYGSQRAFMQTMRDNLIRRKMIRLLWGQALVSEAEARASARHRLEQVSIAFVVLDPQTLPIGEAVSDGDVETYLADHRPEIDALYAERADEFAVGEKIRTRHILFRVEKDAPEDDWADAEQRAGDALARIQGGASFEDVAMELSEDPGSKEGGGDLGFIAREDVNPVLAEAAFSQEIGAVGGPIRSDTGFHLVRAEERAAAGTRPIDEVATELARERAESAAAALRAETLSQELSAAVSEGRSLEEAARASRLTLERTGLIRRRPDGFISGLGASPEVMATAFALDLSAASSPRVFDVMGKRVLIQLLEREGVDDATLEEQVAAERDRLLATKRNRLAQDWVDVEREELTQQRRLTINGDLVLGGL